MIVLIIVSVIVLFFGFAAFFGAPYVPSQRRYVRRALRQLYKLDSKDVLVDIGSGDGLVLRIAAEMGARAIGYEINPLLVLISKALSARQNNISIKLANFWLVDLPDDTTIVYAFSVSRDANKLTKKMQSESDRLGRELHLVMFGPSLKIAPIKTFEACSLYNFRPLQVK